MDLDSSYFMSDVFEEIIQWRKRKEMIPHQLKLRWNHMHLSLVRSYVFKSGFDSDPRLQSIAKLLSGTVWDECSTLFLKMVASFTQLLHQFFLVPTQQYELLNNLKTSERIAGFIHFLVLFPYYYEGGVCDPFKDRMVRLENRLRFLLILLGDTLFVDDEHEQVKNLLAQVESVANKTGMFLHSFFFSKTRSEVGLDEGFDSTFKQMDLLKDDIVNFLDLLPSIYIAPPPTSIVDSPLVDFLIYDLEDLLNLDDSMISDVHLSDHFKMLHQELIVLQSLTINKWSSQPSEAEEPKKSVVGIPDEALHAQYLIKSYLVGDVPPWYFSIRLSQFIHRIKLFRIQLQETEKNSIVTLQQVERNSEEEDDEVTVGSEEKEIEILDQLLGEEMKRKIICIYGMPGIGKTTLARKLYNHPSVNYRFDKRSWCIVSQTYNKKNAMTELFISLASDGNKSTILNMQEEDLVENIYKTLMGRRYLIVLDDIWSPNVWHDLKTCFPDNGNGSRILFTSRNEDVAPPPPDSIIQRLPFLSDEQCWELLKQKVINDQHYPPELQKIGMEIARKCCGLPLAVVVIAGILSAMDKKETTWRKVADSMSSYIFPDQNNRVMQILELSFNHLPAHLKLCFLYFQRFKEYKEIRVQEVIRLWIAEGFIRKEEKKSLESSAEESLMKLIDKSIIMVAKRSSDGRVKTCLLHDLLRDLCSNICSEVKFLHFVDNNQLFYARGYNCIGSVQCSPSHGSQHVRSFQGYLPESQFNVVNLKFLRVLDFNIDDLQWHSLVGYGQFLVQLRYVVVTYLDACLGSLVNLEYLRVENQAKSYDDDDDDDDDEGSSEQMVSDISDDNSSDCSNKDTGGVEIPFVVLKMVKLRDFYINNIAASFGKDCESSLTNNLKLLSNVVIRSFSDEEILRCSPHLRKLKCVCETFQLEETGAYQYPDFSFFTQLESLNMTTRSKRRMADISLPLSLKKLTLSKLSLPWEKMSVIGGLPNLQVLKLLKTAFRGETWETKEDEFQELTFLKLEDLDLVEWNVGYSQHFRKLRQLVVIRCKNLHEIPSEMGEIVQLIEVRYCTDSVAESAQQIEREQRDNGNEELRVVAPKITYHRSEAETLEEYMLEEDTLEE